MLFKSLNAASFAFVDSFDSKTGNLAIGSTNYEAYSDFKINAKIVATDLMSKSNLNTLENIFHITIKD